MKIFPKNKRSSSSNASVAQNNIVLAPKLLHKLKALEISAFKEMSSEEQKRVWQWSKEVIQQYRSALESNPSNIRDAGDLPSPKEDIKLAIKLALPVYVSKGVRSMTKILKVAYKEIGAFQNIDPADKKKLFFETSQKKISSSKNDQDAFRIYEKYMTAVVSEKKALVQEINDFVTDLEALK